MVFEKLSSTSTTCKYNVLGCHLINNSEMALYWNQIAKKLKKYDKKTA